jgi:hypothetical protein
MRPRTFDRLAPMARLKIPRLAPGFILITASNGISSSWLSGLGITAA